MTEEDVLIEAVVNEAERVQFYTTEDFYNTMVQDPEILFQTIVSSVNEGVLSVDNVKSSEDIKSVRFLSEGDDKLLPVSAQTESIQEETLYETYEIVEDDDEDNDIVQKGSELPDEIIVDLGINNGSELPEELIVEMGLSSVTDERLNLCAFCDYRTYNVGHFNIHLRQHTGETPFKCSKCPYSSKQKSNLKRHMRQHAEGRDHFACKYCKFTCGKQKIFNRHLKLHSRCRPLRRCPFCEYFSTSLAHLRVHIRQHTGETPYHCSLCSYKTVQKSNLTRHLKKHRRTNVINKADKLRVCTQCGYRTPNAAHMLAHIRATHTGEAPYACDYCSYKSAQKSNLSRHLRKHTGERPFECVQCNYKTAYAYVLKKHIEQHAAQTGCLFECSECHFKCVSLAGYQRHLRRHGCEPCYTCTTCGYVTVNPSDLEAHIQKCNPDIPLQCHYCSYSTNTKALLRSHMFVHSGGTESDKPLAKDSNSQEEISPLKIDFMDLTEQDNTNEAESRGTVVEVAMLQQNDEEIFGNYENAYLANSDDNMIVAHSSVNEVDGEEDVITTPLEETVVTEVEGENHKTYICTFCSYQSNDVDHIQEHVKDHEGDTPYNCKLCKFRSKEKSNLARHMRKHIGVLVDSVVESTLDFENDELKPNRFLSNLQPEKIKEFKRLLQQGSKLPQVGTTDELIPQRRINTANLKQEVMRSISQEVRKSQQEVKKKNFNIMRNPVITKRRMVTPASEETTFYDQSNEPKPIEYTQSNAIIYDDPPVDCILGCTDNIVQEVVEGKIYAHEETDANLVQEVVEEQVYEVSQEHYDHLQSIMHDSSSVLIVNDNEDSNTPQQCELCGYQANSINDLKDHIQSHTGLILHGCNQCSFTTADPVELIRHEELYHYIGDQLAEQDKPTYACKICGFATIDLDLLTRHLEKPCKPIKCMVCDLRLNSSAALRKHSQKHLGEEAFECYYCSYYTARKVHLKRHMEKHIYSLQLNPFECTKCGYLTNIKRKLLIHMSTHEFDPPQAYTCHYCRFVTLDENTFRSHLGAHKDQTQTLKDQEHTCPFCAYTTYNLGHYTVHMRQHIGSTPFTCNYCPYRSAQRSNLNRHIKLKHNRNGELQGEIFPGSAYAQKVKVYDDTEYKNAIRTKRVPLKEWMMNNAPDIVRKTKGHLITKSEVIPPPSPPRNEKRGKKSSDSKTYNKKRKQSIPSYKTSFKGKGMSDFELKLSEKVHFDVRNVSGTPQGDKDGFNVNFKGTVLKSTQKIRDFDKYGEINRKSELDVSVVLGDLHDRTAIKRVYEQLKESILMLKGLESEENVSSQFTIYFKDRTVHKTEKNEKDIDVDTRLSDIELSSENESEKEPNSISLVDDAFADLDDELTHFNEPSNSKTTNESDPRDNTEQGKKTNLELVRFKLEGVDKKKFLQSKIRERNDKMKELRRLKILRNSAKPKNGKKYFHGIKLLA